MEWLTLWISTFGVVFAIVDPFGYIPIFLAMTSRDSEERRRLMLKRACGTAFITLTFFTLFGSYLLSFFGISIAALQISGGVILLVISFEMLKVIPVHEKISETEESEASLKEDISIIPLAIPMLAGPASIASVIMLSAKYSSFDGALAIVVSAFVTLAITYVTLRSASRILAVVGLTGLKVMTRLMGFLLCAMAIQFIINGVISVPKPG